MPRPLNYLTTLDLDDAWLDELARTCPRLEVRRVPVRSADEITDTVWAEIDVLHTHDVFPRPDQAPRLGWIQLDTSGVEHVLDHPIWSSDVAITTLGGIAPVPMSEFTVMSLLALAHHQPLLEAFRRSRRWPTAAERLTTLTPLPVDQTTATIVGFGRVGHEVAGLLTALGQQVVGLTRRGVARGPEPDLYFDTGRSHLGLSSVRVAGIERLEAVLPRTDFLIVAVPRTPATRGLLGGAQLARLKDGACLVNVSRGGVVDEAALLSALASRRIRYAALDVFDDEPLPADSPWWDEPHTLVTPHVAGLAPRYREQLLELVRTNVDRFQDGRPLVNRADRGAGY
jgi:phosphoglycerate dehydrogenase-like enzyme